MAVLRLTTTTRLVITLAGLWLLGSLAGCVAGSPGGQKQTVYRNAHLDADTRWSGRILIDGTVKLAKGCTLTIAPGTEVAFVRKDADADGLGDATLVVEGRLVAVGTRSQPILFRSAAENPRPGDWLEIRVDFSEEVQLRYCEIRDSAYTLHAHFTRGTVADCTIRHNIDGCRLGQATFTFNNNLIEHNQGKGINFRNSQVAIHHNILRYNGSGIFLFENDRAIDVHHNNFYGNLDNFRLGDFYTGEVALHDNWWGVADLQSARETIYDRAKDPAIGTVSIAPKATWVAETGPRDGLVLQPAWSYATDGYVDADLVADVERLYAVSWDGRLHVLDASGTLLTTKNLGDTMDATPLLLDDLLVVQTWSREVYGLDPASGAVHWRFDYSPSPADDHRQGGATVAGDLVLVPAWNGTLFALDRQTGDRRWTFAGGEPLRSTPAWDGQQIYLASGNGTLHALSPRGEPLWTVRFAQPLQTTPAVIAEGVAVLSRSGEVAAFSRAGRELWRRDLAETCYYGAPVYHDQALYVPTADGALWKLEARTGRVLWRVATSGPVYATPLVDDGRVFLGDNNGAMQVYHAEGGQLLTRVQTEREIQGRALSWQGRLLFGSRDHRVHAFEPVDRSSP